MLEYDGGRFNSDSFFPVKLVFDNSDDVDYLLLWEKVVEYADKTASTNKIHHHPSKNPIPKGLEQSNLQKIQGRQKW